MIVFFPLKPIEGPLTIEYVIQLMVRYNMNTRIGRLLEVDTVATSYHQVVDYPPPDAPVGYRFIPMQKHLITTGSFGKIVIGFGTIHYQLAERV